MELHWHGEVVLALRMTGIFVAVIVMTLVMDDNGCSRVSLDCRNYEKSLSRKKRPPKLLL